MEGTLGLKGETHCLPHPHHHVNSEPAPLPPALPLLPQDPPLSPPLSYLWVLTPALTAPKNALQVSWCTPETQGWVCTTRLPWALIMAQVKTIPSMEVGNNLVCQGSGRMLSAAGTLSGGHLLPGQGSFPTPRVLQPQRQKRHSYLCFNKTRKEKVKGIRPRSSHGHSLPWQGLVRSQYLLPPALRAGGMAAPPSPAEQGRTVPHVVLLLVMFPPEKGAWETLEQRGPGQVPAESVEPARSINTCSHPRTRATHNLPHFPWTSFPCWLHPTQD